MNRNTEASTNWAPRSFGLGLETIWVFFKIWLYSFRCRRNNDTLFVALCILMFGWISLQMQLEVGCIDQLSQFVFMTKLKRPQLYLGLVPLNLSPLGNLEKGIQLLEVHGFIGTVVKNYIKNPLSSGFLSNQLEVYPSKSNLSNYLCIYLCQIYIYTCVYLYI